MKNFLKTMLVMLGVVGVLTVVCLLLIVSEHSLGKYIYSVTKYVISNNIAQIVAIITLFIYGVLCVVSIALSGNIKNNAKGGVILNLKTGEVHISSQTFESIVSNVAKKYKGVKTAKVNIALKETGVGVDIYIYVLQDTVIADITEQIQADIKETISKQTTVVVENVNVRIKGVYTLNENIEVK